MNSLMRSTRNGKQLLVLKGQSLGQRPKTPCIWSICWEHLPQEQQLFIAGGLEKGLQLGPFAPMKTTSGYVKRLSGHLAIYLEAPHCLLFMMQCCSDSNVHWEHKGCIKCCTEYNKKHDDLEACIRMLLIHMVSSICQGNELLCLIQLGTSCQVWRP